MIIKPGNFYLTKNNDIGYLLSGYEHSDYFVLRVDGKHPIYEFHKNQASFLTKKLNAKIILENNIKKIYIPSLDKTLDYSDMCKEYISNNNIFAQAHPFGYKYQIHLDLTSNGSLGAEPDDWQGIHSTMSWVIDNFGVLDYEITKHYTYDYDNFDDGVTQTGYSIWFKNSDSLNLAKILWKNTIEKFAIIIST